MRSEKAHPARALNGDFTWLLRLSAGPREKREARRHDAPFHDNNRKTIIIATRQESAALKEQLTPQLKPEGSDKARRHGRMPRSFKLKGSRGDGSKTGEDGKGGHPAALLWISGT